MNQNAMVTRDARVNANDISGMSALEVVLVQGDLSVLTAQQRVEYYRAVCESVGLNPLTKPFDYIVLNGKLTLYAKKDATDQIRTTRRISITRLEREQTADSYDVTAYGRDRDGREDASLGSVPIAGLKGEALSNAKMKAETKAKRRLTLSLAGLGMLDEVEVGSVPSALPVVVDEDGVILDSRPSTLADAVARAQEKPSLALPEPERPSAPPEDLPAKEDTTEALPEAIPQVPAPEPEPEEVEDDPDLANEMPEEEPGLSLREFVDWVRASFISTSLVTTVVKEEYGEGVTVKDLTDGQRVFLKAVIQKRLASLNGRV